jgi:hypothetical protein
MIHHMSFGVSNPRRVAEVLAELTGKTAMRAPSPPFPNSAWFVIAGDEQGTLLEILPATAVFDPHAPLGIKRRPATLEPVSAHVLVSSVKSAEEIAKIADREGWAMQEVETGLFKIIKLWIDGSVLVEVFAQGEAARYVETFGARGLATLESKLRDLEIKMRSALESKMAPQKLREILGEVA